MADANNGAGIRYGNLSLDWDSHSLDAHVRAALAKLHQPQG